MSKFQVFDTPILNPKNDLLGIENYAKKLADYLGEVTPPFTIGIYGEWGSGKTSFVQMLNFFLTQSMPDSLISNSPVEKENKFITFSAWPYSTTDTLWRALIIKIAKDLYNIPDPAPPDREWARPLKSSNFLAWLLNNLTQKKLVLWQSPTPLPSKTQAERDRAEYHELIKILDKTSYGSVSRDSEQQLQVNQEVALMAIVSAAVESLGAISPLVATLRRFLGIKSEFNLADLLYQEKNEATRQVIESVEEFRQVFSALLKKKAEQYHRIFVFVDDLDRCLPDVALDILEAIKIFLGNAPCIFIVAADENLIAQGLQLRYRELLINSDNEQTQRFYTRKGQEYFEKIIQFGIRVPSRTPAQIRAFISAQFPEWIVASDIIQAGVGSNPRRLIQHCNLLTYQYAVAETARGRLDSGNYLQLFTKMVALRNLFSQRPPGPTLLHWLSQRPGRYLETMRRLEASLHKQSEAALSVDKAIKIADDEFYNQLYLIASDFLPLQRLFSEWLPPFIDTDESHVTLLLPFTNVGPVTDDPQAIFQTQDPVFKRILNAVKRD